MIALACGLDIEIQGHCEMHNTLQLMRPDSWSLINNLLSTYIVNRLLLTVGLTYSQQSKLFTQTT
jgi:hypothetical protein